MWSGVTQLWKYVSSENIPQNILEESIKVTNIDFSMECFTVDFLKIYSGNVQILLSGEIYKFCRLRTSTSIPSI